MDVVDALTGYGEGALEEAPTARRFISVAMPI